MSSEQQTSKEVTLDIRRLFVLIKKHFVGILVWTIGLGLVAYGLSEYVVSPKYTATTQLLVNRTSNDANQAYALQQADVNAVTTYKDLITSNKILKGASKYLANPVTLVRKATPAKKAVYKTQDDGTRVLVKKAVKAKPAIYKRESKSYSVSAKEMKKSVSVTTTTSSQVFTLSATAETPEKAKAIANAIAREFKKQLPSIMEVNNVTIVADATNGTKTFPRVKLMTLAGALIGFMLSLVIVVLRDLSDTTVRENSFMTDEMGLIDLGEVASIKMPKDWTFTPATTKKTTRRRV